MLRRMPLALWLLGALLSVLAFSSLFAQGMAWAAVSRFSLPLALLGLALMVLSGAWMLWRAVTSWRRGAGPAEMVTWAGWFWLSLPLFLLVAAVWLTRSGDWGLTVADPGSAARTYRLLLALWLVPGLTLLWLGRRLGHSRMN
ncbi:hypothetical protein GCM10017783_04590 [Deinococcus piscis]|uniref:Uncharacterized protein n=2 Tax=Deinococcus piscis TaxID=394230 RepID=A0ABQ3JYZ6_9DEIO|nr:hypothetical protein GCM10017783_04590 [Deinococcus piscis]